MSSEASQQVDELRYNPITGEVEEGWRPSNEDAAAGVLVPLNLGQLSEEMVHQAFPTAGQLEQALLASRTRIGRSGDYIVEQSKDLKKAKRDLIVAKGVARGTVRESGIYKTEKDVDAAVDRDPGVYRAMVRVDDAALRLEYARELKSALYLDVEILRSLNSNMRSETRIR
jgi:hypothetical protein